MVILRALLCLLLLTSTGWSMEIGNIHIMTEDYPPYNYREDGCLKGIATDILVEILERIDAPQERLDIELLPWPRGYSAVQKTPATMLYSMARIAEREDMFKWVGPILTARIGLLAPPKASITITAPEDIALYQTGVVKDDVGELLLQRLGVPSYRMEQAPTLWNNVQKLFSGRVQLFAYDITVANWVATQLGHPADSLKAVYLLDEKPMYFAFHLSTPDTIILQFQKALDEMKLPGPDGLSPYNKILDHYNALAP